MTSAFVTETKAMPRRTRKPCTTPPRETPEPAAPATAPVDQDVPAGTPGWISPQLIAQTIRTWQPYYREPLTPQEAVAIIRNVGRLVEVLGSQTDETLRSTRSGQ